MLITFVINHVAINHSTKLPKKHQPSLIKDFVTLIFLTKALRSKIQLNVPTVPSNIDLQYRVLCPNTTGTWTENKLECDQVGIGDEVKT